MKNKKPFNGSFIIMIVSLTISLLCSCSKKENKKDCGCNTSKYKEVKNQIGLLVLKNGTWVLANNNTQFPAFIGFICNENSQYINDITYLNKSDSIPVLFSGKESEMCKGEGKEELTSANFYSFNIIIDSLKAQ